MMEFNHNRGRFLDNSVGRQYALRAITVIAITTLDVESRGHAWFVDGRKIEDLQMPLGLERLEA